MLRSIVALLGPIRQVFSSRRYHCIVARRDRLLTLNLEFKPGTSCYDSCVSQNTIFRSYSDSRDVKDPVLCYTVSCASVPDSPRMGMISNPPCWRKLVSICGTFGGCLNIEPCHVCEYATNVFLVRCTMARHPTAPLNGQYDSVR